MTVRVVGDLGPLSDAERRVLAELDTGEAIDIGDGTLPAWPHETRRLRGSLVRLLSLGNDPKYRLHEKGLWVRGAWIAGPLDLEGCRVNRDITLLRCRFETAPVLRSASIDSLFLNGSRLPGMEADRLEARGGVFLRDVVASGTIRLSGATLKGSLDCSGARFASPENAPPGASLAFIGDGLVSGGSAFFRRIEARGEVRIVGAELAGDLDCTGAMLQAAPAGEAATAAAFAADGMTARGAALLRELNAQGEVRLVGATLGGNLDCDDAVFFADGAGDRRALSMQGARVAGSFFLRGEASVIGLLDLTAVEFGAINDDAACWPADGELLLDRCRYGALTGGPVDAAARLDWLSRQDTTGRRADFGPQPYEQLARVLREMGHEDEAKTVLVRKEKLLRRAELARLDNWPERAMHRLSDLLLKTVGYGYRPQQALAPALVVVLFGWAVVHMAAERRAMLPTAPPTPGIADVALAPLVYSFETFVPIIQLGQAKAFRPDMSTPPGWWTQVYLWVHGLLGWLIGGIAAAGIFGLMKRS